MRRRGNIRPKLRELFFRVAVTLKGIDGVIETAAGVALLLVPPEWVAHTLSLLGWHALGHHPGNFIANSLLDAADRFSVGTQHFAAAYLIAHGVVKVGLVAGLLKDQHWAYPAAMIVFAAFVVYMFYRFTITHALALIVLAGFDVVVIGLIWLEYRSLER